MRRIISRMRLLSLALLLLAALQDPPKVLARRGPYIQNVRQDAAVVCVWLSTESEASVTVGDKVVSSPRATRHFMEITGLKSGTEYTYVVQAGALKVEPATFRTAPAADAAVNFVAFGDCRSNHDMHAKIVDLVRAQKPEFVLCSGDLVERGVKPELWDEFLRLEGPLLRTTPLYPALGNHEDNAPEYFDIFVLPGNERWYSFDWGPVHVVALDTTKKFRWDDKQLAWLKADLAASKATFKVVIWHYAPYSASSESSRESDSKALTERYAPILKQGGVCLALGGHNHNYQRAEADGVCYVTTAGGGAKLYDIGELPELKASKKAHHICRLRAEGKKLTLEAVDLEGAVIDTWTHAAP